VCFLNSIADEHLARLYTTCEALICASSIEGFCLPVAEALLFSCRVICSNIPVLREVAGDQGTYFGLEPRSSDAIVEAISSSMSSNSHTAGQSRLFTSNPAEEWPKLYAGVLERHFESRAIKPKMVSPSSES
jgi:glycosyltransferase involved in cell wall biosynthesis